MVYPEDEAITVWKKDDVTLSIVKHPHFGHLCGYARFPKPPLKTGDKGIAAYVPVHGGITFYREYDDGSVVYGFDCAHVGDWTEFTPKGKKWTVEKIKKEAEKMVTGIRVAAKYEDRYLEAKTPRERAKVIDEYHDELRKEYGIEFDLTDNFMAMLRVFTGEL